MTFGVPRAEHDVVNKAVARGSPAGKSNRAAVSELVSESVRPLRQLVAERDRLDPGLLHSQQFTRIGNPVVVSVYPDEELGKDRVPLVDDAVAVPAVGRSS